MNICGFAAPRVLSARLEAVAPMNICGFAAPKVLSARLEAVA